MSDSLRKHLLGLVGALAVTIGAAGSALAVPGSIPGGQANDGLQPLFGQNERQGFFGETLYLIGGPANIEVAYLGAEAGYSNSFTFGGGPAIFNTGSTPAPGNWAGLQANDSNAPGTHLGAQTHLNVSGGPLSFSFSTPNGGVANGSPNNNSGNLVNFFISFGNENAAGGQIAYLFLDDGGADDDDNHDDMVIRLMITGDGTFVVPLPAAAWLLIAGIGGLGLVARRRKAGEA